jgi:hypothetical protein
MCGSRICGLAAARASATASAAAAVYISSAEAGFTLPPSSAIWR